MLEKPAEASHQQLGCQTFASGLRTSDRPSVDITTSDDKCKATHPQSRCQTAASAPPQIFRPAGAAAAAAGDRANPPRLKRVPADQPYQLVYDNIVVVSDSSLSNHCSCMLGTLLGWPPAYFGRHANFGRHVTLRHLTCTAELSPCVPRTSVCCAGLCIPEASFANSL